MRFIHMSLLTTPAGIGGIVSVLGHVAVCFLVGGNFQGRTEAPAFGVNQSVAAFAVELAFEQSEEVFVSTKPDSAFSQKNDAPVVLREKVPTKKLQSKTSPPKDAAAVSRSSSGDATSTTQHAAPAYASNPPPVYPESARRAGQEGVTILLVTVDRGGSPTHVDVSESSGFMALDEAAVSAVEDWAFRPGTINGQPAETTVEVPIRFSLSSQP